MASNKSDARRPLCCAADDDAFPLPDYLAPIADRPVVVIQNFIDTPMPTPPPIPPPSPPPPTTTTTTTTNKQQQQHAKPNSHTRIERLPRAAIVAALQPPGGARAPSPNPIPPPTFSALLQHLPAETPSTPPQQSTFVNITIYNSQSPTKSATLSLPSTTPLIYLIDNLPCTARPNLSNTPSSALLYIGNTLYHHTLPRRTNYATPIQKFLRQNSPTRPPDLHAITATSPTLANLSVSLGAPYPLLHHADCEHLIIFTDLFHSPQQNPTPTTHHRPLPLTPCDVCRRRAADRFTVADPLADASPFHYCPHCFRHAHYCQSGQVFDRTAGFRVYSHHNPM